MSSLFYYRIFWNSEGYMGSGSPRDIVTSHISGRGDRIIPVCVSTALDYVTSVDLWSDNCHGSFTGSEIIRGSAEFRVFLRIFGPPWDQCKSGEKSESLLGGVYLRNYLAHRNGSPIKIFRISQGNVWESLLHCVFMRNYYKFRENVRLNTIVRGSCTSKSHDSDPRKHAPHFFSLNCNLAFHSLNLHHVDFSNNFYFSFYSVKSTRISSNSGYPWNFST